MNKDKLLTWAKKLKDAGIDGTAKVVSSVSGETPKEAKKLVNHKLEDAKIYTAESINAAEGFLEEHDAAGKLQKAVDTVGKAYESVKTGSDKVADHFTNEHFDEQTAEIRNQLAHEHEDDADEEDIVIDATSDQDKDETDDDKTDKDDKDKDA